MTEMVNADISGLGGDFSSYLRLLFVTQEFTTDEAIVAWGDGRFTSIKFSDMEP